MSDKRQYRFKTVEDLMDEYGSGIKLNFNGNELDIIDFRSEDEFLTMGMLKEIKQPMVLDDLGCCGYGKIDSYVIRPWMVDDVTPEKTYRTLELWELVQRDGYHAYSFNVNPFEGSSACKVGKKSSIQFCELGCEAIKRNGEFFVKDNDGCDVRVPKWAVTDEPFVEGSEYIVNVNGMSIPADARSEFNAFLDGVINLDLGNIPTFYAGCETDTFEIKHVDYGAISFTVNP